MSPAKLLWSRKLDAPPVGMAVAREAGCVVIWDSGGTLTAIDHLGRVTGRHQHPSPVRAAAIADDGSCVISTRGTTVTRFTPDLRAGVEIRLAAPATACALDVGGDYSLTAEESGRLTLWSRDGSPVREWSSPRPAKFLALLGGTPHVIVAAETGFIGRLDLTNGQWLWRDRPVVLPGSLSADADGRYCVLACYSEGMRAYGPEGKPVSITASAPPKTRFAAVSADGRRAALITLDHAVMTAALPGRDFGAVPVGKAGVAIGLSADGDTLYLSAADSHVCAFALA